MRSALRTAAIGLALAASLTAPSRLHAQAAAHETHATFTGAWEVTFDSQMGRMTWVFTLDLEGGVLSGLAEAEGGTGTMPVDGTQDDETVAFVVQVEAPDHSVTLEFEGTVDGDAASGSVAIGDGVYEWTAARVDAGD